MNKSEVIYRGIKINTMIEFMKNFEKYSTDQKMVKKMEVLEKDSDVMDDVS